MDRVLVWTLQPGARLSQLLPWALERGGDRLLLTQRRVSTSARRFDSEIRDGVRARFGSRLLRQRTCGWWPGTRLVGHDALVYEIALDEVTARLMIAAEDVLASWQHDHEKRLPEDPCVLRGDDELPLAYSVTHDRNAWVLQDPSGSGLPVACRETSPRELLLVPPGPSFCGPCEPSREPRRSADARTGRGRGRRDS